MWLSRKSLRLTPRTLALLIQLSISTSTGVLGQPESSSPPRASQDATGTRGASTTSPAVTLSGEPICESRTVNYITHTLPQQCLTSSPEPLSVPEPVSATMATDMTASTSSQVVSATKDAELDDDGDELSTGAFMSFEEWKAMMLAKVDQEAIDTKPRKKQDRRGEAQPAGEFDTLGDEGEISFDFDSYSDKISEITVGTRPASQEKDKGEQTDMAAFDEDLAIYRSKDAGKTCKERFSYSSFDAGATTLKVSQGTKNPTAILGESKDSYMLMECATPNKFFIVELSDVILVDTVVLANYEFFSSMIRRFRVSVSDRYPVKLDKWTVLGTFEARNSRNIQAFLVENPRIWARYLRIEILSHYGNEFYCPLSLLRVHGMRMLDSLRAVDPAELEAEEEPAKTLPEDVEETEETIEDLPEETHAVEPSPAEEHTIKLPQSKWMPYGDPSYFEHRFLPESTSPAMELPCSSTPPEGASPQTAGAAKPRSPRTAEQTSTVTSNTSTISPTSQPTESFTSELSKSGAATDAPERWENSSTANATESTPTPTSSLSVSLSGSANGSQTILSSDATSSTSLQSSNARTVSKNRTVAATSVKPPPPRSTASRAPSGSAPPTSRNKTTTSTTSSAAPSPTVQDSFFKTLTKRLQTLETNTTLSLQYIESQSRFLQEALAKLEKRQVAKVDLFLDKLNKTVLGELREVRTQYDQIWQSTVIALETQREQSEREIVALGERVGVLADEVVFQKRMAIAQSALLLICLVLFVFSSRGGGLATTVESYYPSQFLPSSSRLASPIFPSTPKGEKRQRQRQQEIRDSGGGEALSADEPGSSSPPAVGSFVNSRYVDMLPRSYYRQSPSQTLLEIAQRQAMPRRRWHGHGHGHAAAGPTADPAARRPSQTRAATESAALDYMGRPEQPATPTSMDIGYDSEPATTPGGNYFSTTASVNRGESGTAPGMVETMPRQPPPPSSSYSEGLARKSERQLTPQSAESDEEADYLPRPARPTVLQAGSSRVLLPALPEDPD
ncbi:hypothetical protein DL764_002004 [Monosporascus ibericus]|uniref:SUN domain-containing protein n=1 Tax=Monosporascus ibericus TaxID=155417 RepID=A0A4Q4TRP0_9PEZI|nr:hypothetical protein DL764_002004 [Monosporascus ibericus]